MCCVLFFVLPIVWHNSLRAQNKGKWSLSYLVQYPPPVLMNSSLVLHQSQWFSVRRFIRSKHAPGKWFIIHRTNLLPFCWIHKLQQSLIKIKSNFQEVQQQQQCECGGRWVNFYFRWEPASPSSWVFWCSSGVDHSCFRSQMDWNRLKWIKNFQKVEQQGTWVWWPLCKLLNQMGIRLTREHLRTRNEQ